ncbi:MAG: hypothetical protein JRK53_16590 [Deltaproteobacteria bacterium]|nr:hypothetical protein [Deltaproteobacteria bacterium]
MKDLRKEGIHFKSDERILGGSDFVESVLKEQETDSFMGVTPFPDGRLPFPYSVITP